MTRVVGWGGTITVEGVSVPIRNLTISRQASEVDVTAHGDSRNFAIPGRVKRGGSFEAYVGTAQGGIVSQMESPTLATPLTLVYNGTPALTMDIAVTSCEFAYAADDAAIYTVTFVESVVIP